MKHYFGLRFFILVFALSASVSAELAAAEALTEQPEQQTPESVTETSPAQLPEKSADTGAEQLLRAQVKARESTQISSEMAGRIKQLKIRDGERFTKGQVLVSFDCSMEEAQLSKVKATLDKKQKTHEVNQKLAKLNSISNLQLDVSKAEQDEAVADVQVGQVALEHCTIKAPFSGKVVEVTARAYQSVRESEPLLEIINDKDLEIEFIAPSKAMLQLKPGRAFKVTVDENAKIYKGQIIRLGGRVDPVSQTIKVFGRITDNSAELLPGMSGAITLPTE